MRTLQIKVFDIENFVISHFWATLIQVLNTMLIVVVNSKITMWGPTDRKLMLKQVALHLLET